MPATADFNKHSTSFIVEGVLNGHTVRILVDTGASICFIAAHWLTTVGIDNDQLPAAEAGLTVRLGDSSTSLVNRTLKDADLTLGNHSSRWDFHVLTLPRGFDAVLGMDFMARYDVTLRCSDKAVRILDGDQSFTASGQSLSTYLNPRSADCQRLHAMKYITEESDSVSFKTGGDSAATAANDPPVETEARRSSDSPSNSQCFDTDDLPDAGDFLCGIHKIEGSDNDIEVVDNKTYNAICHKFLKGTLDWDSYSSVNRKEPPVAHTEAHSHWEQSMNQLKAESDSADADPGSQRRWVLYVGDDNRWCPASLPARQLQADSFLIRTIRGGNDIRIPRGSVTGFSTGKLNGGNGSSKKKFSLEKDKCHCCLKPLRLKEANIDSLYCPNCKYATGKSLACKKDIDAFVSRPTVLRQSTDSHSATDNADNIVEDSIDSDVTLCHLDFLTSKDGPATVAAAVHTDATPIDTAVKYSLLHAQAVIDKAQQQWDLLREQINKEAGIDASNVDDYLQQKYPIELSQINSTVTEQLAWVTTLFEQKLEKLGCLDKLEHWSPKLWHAKLKIRVKPDTHPAKVHRHSVPVHLKEELRKFHDDLYKRGFIEPIYDAEHLSPVVLVKKPTTADGKSRGYRMVVNMIARNATLESIANRMPDCTEIFMALKHAKFLSSFDLENGYWNVSLDESSKRLTAFGSEMGSWVWKCLPQGMVSSGPYFQAWCERLFRRYNILASQQGFADLDKQFDLNQLRGKGFDSVDDKTFSDIDKDTLKRNLEDARNLIWRYDGYLHQYLDDSLLGSLYATETLGENGSRVQGHREHLLQFLRICSLEGLPIQPSKSHVFCKYLRFLGVIVGQGKLICCPEKVKSVVAMTPPTSQKLLRGFLGAVGWFRLWIAGFAGLQEPLNELLKGKSGDNRKFASGEWSDRHQNAFEELKKRALTFPVLRVFDPRLSTELVIDASEHHVAAALTQRMSDDKVVVIAYWSRALNDAERKYSSQEREFLGLCCACKVFRHYIMGAHFKVGIFSDHKSLSQIKLNKVEANRVGRWNMLMSEFDCTIFYLPGPVNHLADYLSRAIELPSEEWERAGPGADTEDTFAFPFLYAWPTLATEVIRHHNRFEARFLLLNYEYSLDDENVDLADPVPEDIFTAVQISDHQEEAYTQLADEAWYQDCKPTNAFNSHEQVLLGLHQHTFTASQVFEESQYLLCPDFGPTYGRIRYPDPDDRRNAVTKAKQLQKDSCSIPPLTAHHRGKRSHSGNDSAYHIDNGILYYESPVHGDVVCIPHGYSTTQSGARCKGATVNLPSSDSDDANLDADANRSTVCSTGTADDSHLTLREFLISELHDTPLAGHRGIGQTYALTSKRYYWPNMHADVAKWINGCSACVLAKIDRRKAKGTLQRVQRPLEPGKSFNFDFMTNLPAVQVRGLEYSRIAVLVDRCTKRGFLYALPTNTDSEMLANVIFEELSLKEGYGVISELISDRDSLLTSKFSQALYDRVGTKLSMATSRTQWTNGTAERMIAVIEEILRTKINWSQMNWVELIPFVTFVVNNMPQTALQGHSAFYYERGVEPTLPVDLIKLHGGDSAGDAQSSDSSQKILAKDRIAQLVDIRTKLHAEIQTVAGRTKEQYEKVRRVAETIVPGTSRCWLRLDGLNVKTLKLKGANRTKKLNPLWFGPFEVLRRTGILSYQLDLPTAFFDAGVHDTFHVNNLRVYDPNKVSEVNSTTTLPDTEPIDSQYEIQSILSHRKFRNRNEFLIRWVGHNPLLTAEFVEEAELRLNAKEILEEYMAKNNIISDGMNNDQSSDEDNSASPPSSSDQAQIKKRKRTTRAAAAQKDTSASKKAVARKTSKKPSTASSTSRTKSKRSKPN